ncbi:carbamoyl-phosphate synthase subunit L [Nocardioides sp. TRM66260-LWL]|uniref:acetyl/propionyl/methylcrotonyl-CoA carboxylase subunit alpha n=1 Tax=Nocardioides sp. TRM66260-LWL TaxID=2874478 RepID=UPI001CC80BA3|nr:biotin carboxylase N-terminal domain-containing protein [Nocardioides sp. TRM66260-LWL]MBZ5735624.1 carbamoyl-phosphate synthase subunit L [Nocardioides sp. TRM66260-LWL]
MIQTLLIANRGEIAIRVARTARALGVRTIAVHVDGEERAPHVRATDAAVRVPSYLDVDAVVAAALEAGADAVHPGYGFLSERAPFAAAVATAGLTFVGPSASVMERMGHKDAAREIAQAAGVPVVPRAEASDGAVPRAFPVLVKAAAGGGGKGMRIVRTAAELPEAVLAARREAERAFGDGTLLVERYVERGRHVEVQVLADAHGTVVHLGDRDCSAQRRHQKVLEEAPAPDLDPGVRALMLDAAVALAREVGYVNAGTVEFLLDVESGEPYFLEMNTRLQVEHPVTEGVVRVAGRALDLVEQQLRIAAGEPLGFAQDDVAVVGHAIEARVYAEDAYGGFLPQAGTATHVVWPSASDGGVRVDHALESGQVVSTAFDPMLGKVIAVGADRDEARRGLLDALDRTAILGLTTNVGFLRALAASDAFAAGPLDTAWLDRHALPEPDDADARAIVGLALRGELASVAQAGPWADDGFRSSGGSAALVEHGRTLTPPSGHWHRHDLDDGLVRLAGDVPPAVGFVRRPGSAGPGSAGGASEVVVRGQRFVLGPRDTAWTGVSAGDGTLAAPMPGTVLDVRVAPGDAVAAGDVLGVVEAMKMELALAAPFDGTVTSVDAVVGSQVALGAVLFVVEAGE